MAGLKKKRRMQLIGAAVVFLITATALVGYAFRDGISYFRSPSQVAEAPPPANETFRIGGLVEVDSLIRGQGETIRFNVTDGGAAIAVAYTGILPDLFSEGTGMIATGKLVNNVFVASEILAKHDEQYMPKEVADALKEQGVFREQDGG